MVISDPTPFRRTTAVVRDRRHVPDHVDAKAGRLQRPNGRLAPGARALHVHVDLPHAALHRFLARHFTGPGRRERRAFAGPFETLVAGARPDDRVSAHVRDGHDRVIERGLNVGYAALDDLLLPLLAFLPPHAAPPSHDLERLPCLALALGLFSCPCVCFGSLPSYRQPPAVPEPAIAPDVDEPFDVHRHFLAEVSLHLVLPLNDLPQLHDLILAEILHARRRRDSRLGQDLGGQRPPDAIDVRQPNMDLFLPREINSGDACHTASLLSRCFLPLPLLVPGCRAEHSNDPTTPDHSTFRADRFDRRFHFHGRSALTRDGCRYLNRYVIRPG